MPRKTWFLFFTIFIDMIGIGVLIPVIPQLLGEPNSPYFLLGVGEQQLGFLLLGLISAVYPLTMFFASPILGSLSDKYGRRPVLLISILGTAIGYFIFAFAIFTKNLPLLFFSRIIDGLTGGNISTVQASLADQTKVESRAKVFGMMGAVFGLGFILGPFLGGKLADPQLVSWFNATTPFIFSGILSLINFFSIYFFFTETNVHIDKNRIIDFFGAVKNITRAKRVIEIKNLLFVSFLFNAGFAFFTSFFNVFLTTKFSYTASQTGTFFGYIGLWIIIAQLFVVRYISKRYKDIYILRFAYIATGIAVLLYLVPKNPLGLFFVTPFFALPNGLQQANFNALLSRRTLPERRGEVMGISTSVNALGQALPPLVAGGVAAIFSPTIPIIIASVVITIAGVIFIKTEKVVN